VCDRSDVSVFRCEPGSLACLPVCEFAVAGNRYRIPCQQRRTGAKDFPGASPLRPCHDAHLRSKRTAPVDHRHLLRHESWCSSHRENGQRLGYLPPFCASGMLVGSHDGRIQEQVLQIRVAPNLFHQLLPHPSLAPTIEALKHRVPSAESLGQIAPWRPGFCDPQHGIDESSIVASRPPGVAPLAGKMRFDLLPLFVGQFMSPHRFAPP